MYAIHTNVGKNRKPLVATLTNLFGYKPEYAGAPTFAYDFGTCKVDRYGTLILPRSLNAQGADRLASVLDDHGFECSIEHIEGGYVASDWVEGETRVDIDVEIGPLSAVRINPCVREVVKERQDQWGCLT